MLNLNLPESHARACFEQEFLSGRNDRGANHAKERRLARSQKPAADPEDDDSKTPSSNRHRFGPMIGKSRSLRKAFNKMARMAHSHANAIIYGESGTGKELAAKTIHTLSPRRHHRFVPVHCGAIPDELVESEIFGYKKGAFTGAVMDKPGYLDRADKGSLFLDEIGELPLSMQVKLLRVIDGGGYTPVGSQDIKKPDIRIIAATNRDLRENVHKGLMREDFYYRIHVLPIWLPPLRERIEDLPLLIDYFMLNHGRRQIPAYLMNVLKGYHWPGNIRELQNTIQRYVALNEIDFLQSPQKTAELKNKTYPDFCCNLDLKSALEKFEKEYIVNCLKVTGGHKSKACKILKINRKTLYKKMCRYDLNS
jgi:transcriptional regulator with PAS, ATPase and Fis domain